MKTLSTSLIPIILDSIKKNQAIIMFEAPTHVKKEPESEICLRGARERDDPTEHQVHLKERLEFRVEVSCVKVEPSDALYADRVVKEEPECIHRPDSLMLHGTPAASSPVLAQHSVQHSAQQQCALTCENNTEQQEAVLQQTNTQHLAGTPVYGCDACGKTYKRKKFLISHINVHMQKFSGKTPFFKKGKECDICKLKFTNLAKHKRTHTSEKPFACKTCHRTFKQSRHLEEHLQIHGEKLHSCDICLKKFAQSRTLITHRRIHTGEQPYFCKVCPKKFKQYGNLKVHERTHTGEKPFKCEVCSKAFAILSDMKRHHRIHTGDKPYSCKICKKKFNLSHHLKRHKEKHSMKKLYS